MYHVNNDGQVMVCEASKRACPYKNHFKTEEEAYEFIESVNKEKYGLLHGYHFLGDNVNLLHSDKVMLFIDIEMTGNMKKKKKNARIVELAMKRVRNNVNGYQILEEFKQQFNPGEKMNPYASRLTGITDEMLENKPKINSYANEIQKFIDSSDAIVLHGGKNDKAALSQSGLNINDVGIFDTVSFYKQWDPKETKTSLSRLCEKHGIVMDEAHDAMNDVEGMMGLYYKITDMNAPEFEKLQKYKKLIKKGFFT